ncbi:MAG: HEAT repeat domain-containing protein [Planctomycetales bacterium]|nr:HEAT repeat domain-containing protein [Planctomycetales bacterium]
MFESHETIVALLARTTLAVSVLVLASRGLLAALKIHSPQSRRAVAVVALAAGWMGAPIHVTVPWYEPELSESRPSEASWENGAKHSRLAKSPGELPGELPASSLANTSPINRSQFASNPLAYELASFETSDSWEFKAADGNQQRGAGTAVWLRALSRAAISIWLIGMAAMILLALADYGRSVRRSRRWRVANGVWRDEWQRLLAEAGVRRTIPLLAADDSGPMLTLLPRGYVLVVPSRFWSRSNPSEREAILRHELSHLLRGDIWKTWLVYLLALPQWFNPLARGAARDFREAGEWLSDRDAARTPALRIDFLRALSRLVELQRPCTSVAGHCAHAHPLLFRVRRLLDDSSTKDSNMKRMLLTAMVIGLAIVSMVRVELVARETDNLPPAVQAVKEKMEALDARIESIQDSEGGLKEHAEKLKESVEAKVEQLKQLREMPDQFSDEAKRRAKLFMTNEEAKQLEAVDALLNHPFRDEAVLLAGYAAKQSEHESVRRKAIGQFIEMGKDGYPALALCYEALNTKDRIFLVKQTAKLDADDRAVLIAHMLKDADDEMIDVLLSADLPQERRLLLVGAVAEKKGQAFIGRIVEMGDKTEGDAGLLMLYAVAKSKSPEHVAKAVRVAAKRGEAALPVLAAAFKCEQPDCRAEVVRAAKKIGGEASQFIIQHALTDANDELRTAAEAANGEK